jgi:hypothetical protein
MNKPDIYIYISERKEHKEGEIKKSMKTGRNYKNKTKKRKMMRRREIRTRR